MASSDSPTEVGFGKRPSKSDVYVDKKGITRYARDFKKGETVKIPKVIYEKVKKITHRPIL